MTPAAPWPCAAAATRAALAVGALALLGACTAPPVPATPYDPHESVNRAWFERNLALDRALSGDGPAQPSEPSAVRTMVRNVAANLGTPSTVMNDLLQVRPDRAMENTLRFAINSTVGLAGLFDPAGAMGLHGRESDFGETLHRWGMGEGAYVMLPLLGPTTERDMLGMVIDSALNPWDRILTPTEARGVGLARIAGRIADRAEYADVIDANVTQAADPYAQARLLYLQARRYHLGIQTEADAYDPYDALLD